MTRRPAPATAALPVEILYGLYLGALIGVVPVLVAWTMGFLFKYVTGVTVPALGVAVLAVAIAGANGGLLALNDPSLTASGNQVRPTVALVVVLMGAFYAHAVGDRLGAQLPRRITLRRLTERTLSADVVERVGGRGRVRVQVAGEVGDIEGYPPLPADLRATLQDASYAFPADLPLVELETRFVERLRTEHDLAEVTATLDERAQATVSAAPPVGGLSKRVPSGQRAVTVRAPAPAGLAPGDRVAVTAGGTTRTLLRLLAFVAVAGLTGALVATVYRWYARRRVPLGPALLFGIGVVAVYLNTVGLYGDILEGTAASLFTPEVILFNVGSLVVGGVGAAGGRVVGDRW